MGFLSRSFPLVRLLGVDVRIHALFLLWMGYNLVTAGARWQDELLFMGLLFGIVLCHEFGHCLGARSVGGEARDIILWPLGGLAYASAPMRAWPQFVTVAAGPLVNVLFCILSAAGIYIVSGGAVVPVPNPLNPQVIWLHVPEYLSPIVGYLFVFFTINLYLLAFNLLPVFPLDGGQLFRAALWPFMGLQRATILAAQAGIVGAVCLGVWGAMSQRPILLAIALYGGLTSFQHLRAAQSRMLIEDFVEIPPPGRGGRSFWARMFGRSARPKSRGQALEFPNPNPGGWEQRQDDLAREEEELDRLLRKVSSQGIRSLSYVERQRLERITRERRDRDREMDRDGRG